MRSQLERVVGVVKGHPSRSVGAGLLALVALAACRRDVPRALPTAEPPPETAASASSAPAPRPPPSAAAQAGRSAQRCAEEALAALEAKDMHRLAGVAHPTHGVRFTPFAFVRPEDVVLHASELERGMSDATIRSWGQWGEGEEPIRQTFRQFYARFVYDADYARSSPAPAGTTDPREGASFNVASLRQTLRDTYPKGTVFEYRVPPKTPGGIDWRVLRLVCEPQGDAHYLVGVVHSEWTP